MSEIEGPSPGRKALNLAKAIAKHVAAGLPRASDDVIQDRLAICHACEHYDEGICNVCGCRLDVKTSWADQSCPLDPPKWGAVQ